MWLLHSMKKTYITTVAFVGLTNVGKSSLLNALVGTKIAPTTRKPQTTRRIIRGILTKDNYQQIYFDTPGILRKETELDRFMRNQIYTALADVDQVVVIVDAQVPSKKYHSYLTSIKEHLNKSGQNCILVINKIDTIKDKKYLLGLISEYATQFVSEIVPISALTHDGLDELFLTINKHARPGEFLFSEEQFTDASEKDIAAELIREKAMLELKEELPYALAVTIESFDESRREQQRKPIIEIDANIHVERDSQKSIVIGKGGETLKTIGTRARKDLEHLLHCQVMLRLFVRVEPDWTASAKSLRKLGMIK
jgi:GTP-binding protein Era